MSTATPTDWTTRPAPGTAQDWIARAAEVAAGLATDAVERDRAGATPYPEVQLLQDYGLVTLPGPTEHGGGGQDWPTAYRVVREVAKADGSIGQLLGYHYLWNWAARLVGTREQWEHVEAEAARGAGVIAALSANKAWDMNQKLARRAFEGNVSGHTAANLEKVAKIMAGTDPTEVLPMTMKTGNFFR